MFATIITLIVIVAIVLILVILAQNSKGGGLTSQFGGSGTSQLMGVKKTGDLLEKMTWSLAIALIVLTMSTKFLIGSANESGEFVSPNIESAQDKAISPSLNMEEEAPTATEELPAIEEATEEAE
ncbi:preprotein translocase subunit SecG [Gilvimarinus agarilyticus]|uniref:Protein-export membrane protein SecG n=1 Tax=Reichenbachiella agariperforans TaxID=156994 RepID=A0A1M6JZD0_REIAG|nr:preprotein translocase subunit SecG [Reichenbachiella agariperforans]MBU2887915.1 preprotein translocase subunit SecG [Gilvimarinus agarilyticus]MBU2913363.1 preprotein translocase subunit SecG [Reichenbachiella agariperforans]SHJ52063.1 preprotein translocase subunit SecG [Reichenbachiella agariperforans]